MADLEPIGEPNEAVRRLATGVERAGLREAVILALEIVSPLDVISCQIAQFSRPFLAGHRWESYAVALTEQEAWQTLRRLLTHGEC